MPSQVGFIDYSYSGNDSCFVFIDEDSLFFLKRSVDDLFIRVDESDEASVRIRSFDDFKNFIDNSDYKNSCLCKILLTGFVRQCSRYSNLPYFKYVFNSMKLLNINTFGNDLDDNICKFVSKYLIISGYTDEHKIMCFTYECIDFICKDYRDYKESIRNSLGNNQISEQDLY